MPQETIPSKIIEEIEREYYKNINSKDFDELDDFDAGIRSGLLKAKNICIRFITNQQKGA